MKHKKKVISLFIILAMGVLIFKLIYPKFKELAANEVLELVKSGEEHTLLYSDLENYENKIEYEMEECKDAYDFKISNYALGVIEYERENYDSSIAFLENALEYVDKENSKFQELDVMSYSTLSDILVQKNQIDKAEEYFNKAEYLAHENDMEGILCEVYYRRAKSVLKAGYNLDDVVNLTEKSLEYSRIEEHFIRNYIFLAKLYKLQGNFEESLNYIEESLSKSISINNNELINRSILSLAETYYLQGNYKNTIYIYENLLDTGRIVNRGNLLDIYGYLMDSYGNIGDYDNYNKYKELYLNSIEDLDTASKIKELVWILNKCAKLELDFGNLEIAKRYLAEAEKLYNESPRNMYYNMELYIEYNKNSIEYYENKSYEEALESYEKTLEKLIEKGIGTDLKKKVISDMARMAYENKDYVTMIKYMNLEERWINHSDADTDQLFIEADNILNEVKVRRAQMKVAVLSIGIMIMVVDRIRIKRKNNEIKKLNYKLDEMRKIDGLTNVYNRGYFEEVCSKLMKSKGFVSLVMIDIDYFKQYNDNYGHIEGDRVLTIVAKVIKNVFLNDKVFRYGGEEFIVVSEKDNEELISSLEELQIQIKDINIVHDYSKVSDLITVSVGATSGRISKDKNLSELINRVDENLYKSKKRGRNQYTYDN